MNRKNAVLWILPAALVAAGCAGQRVPPQSLADARADYFRAKDGPAARLDPSDLHEADLALQRAEQAFDKDPDAPTTNDLAIIADRKALLAVAQTGTIQAQQDALQANTALEAVRAQQLQSARGELSQSQDQLGRTQMQLQAQESAAAAQQAHMQELEAKLKDARATIAKIASIKDDDRGMVITLSGEVLFKTGKSDLKLAALAKLDQIAQALEGKDQPIMVYGFTDNVGSRDKNMGLSMSRAQAVRDYLVSKGIPKDLVEFRGDGPDNPVADNTSIEGRAQNRRVEIVVEPRK